ncbi:MAG: STAS domain-containing protein [Kouleothrix sp.]|jgi:anti-anti-sigma regulatory factor|nr:STAS domain-containing protein [Kouleothrix sp.]
MIRLTQHQIEHGVFGLVTVGLFLLLILNAFSPAPAVSVVDSAIAVLVFGGIWAAYWRGWAYAWMLLIIGLTLLTIFGIPAATLQDFVPSVLVVPAITLIFGSPLWVLVSTVCIFIGMAIRAGGTGDYVDPSILTVSGMVVGAMILSRLAIDNVQRLEAAKREAEAERARAETERVRAEQQAEQLTQRNAEQERLIELVATLETPTITVADGVLLAPIVGTLDSRRAQALTTRLLEHVSAQRIQRVILDIAGVSTVDTQVAQAILRTAQALSLLGCHVTITGISATIAMLLTHLNISLDSVTIARSPKEALERYHIRQG